MQRNLPPLNALRAFEAAGRLSSFSKAGEELHVSHSSISRHVRGLEARIGAVLFKNLPRGVGLTEAGATYLKEVSAALDQISDATEQLAPKQKQIIRLSCEPTFALKWLMPVLGGFTERYPQVELQIDPTHKLVDLHQRQFDLAIRFCSKPVVDLNADVISQAPVSPVGAPKLMSSSIDLNNPETLLKLPILTENHADLWAQWFAKAGLPAKKLKRKGGDLRTMLAIEAAAAGQGLALVSTELIYNDLNEGRLVRFSNVGLDYGNYSLLHTKATMRRKAVANFRSWLLDASRDLRK